MIYVHVYVNFWPEKKSIHDGFNPQYTPVIIQIIFFAATIILSSYTPTTNQVFLQDRLSHWGLGDY